MQEQWREDTTDRTNNFHAYFRRELRPPEELEGHLYYSGVGEYIAELEAKGGLWSRLKQTQPQLVKEILERLQKEEEEWKPDHDEWMKLMRAHDFDAADKFDEEHSVIERSKEINRGLNPLLNRAFDLLVFWGAGPKSLRM